MQSINNANSNDVMLPMFEFVGRSTIKPCSWSQQMALTVLAKSPVSVAQADTWFQMEMQNQALIMCTFQIITSCKFNLCVYAGVF